MDKVRTHLKPKRHDKPRISWTSQRKINSDGDFEIDFDEYINVCDIFESDEESEDVVEVVVEDDLHSSMSDSEGELSVVYVDEEMELPGLVRFVDDEGETFQR